MNKKSGFVLRMVAGLYLSYLGIALFSQAMRDKPSDYMMKAVIAVIFLGVGVWYTLSCTIIRAGGKLWPERTNIRFSTISSGEEI